MREKSYELFKNKKEPSNLVLRKSYILFLSPPAVFCLFSFLSFVMFIIFSQNMHSLGRIFVVLFLVSFCVILLFSLLAFVPSASGPANRVRDFTLADSVRSEPSSTSSTIAVTTSAPTSSTESPTTEPINTTIAVFTASPPPSRGVTLSPSPLFAPQFPPASITLAKMTSACASLFSSTSPENIAFVINAREGVRFVPSAAAASSSPLLQVATCPIDKVSPGTRRVHATTAGAIITTTNAATVCKTVLDVALVGDLYRPQHTMQFLFSLMGVVALQSEFNLYQAQVPVFVNVMKYGAVGSAKEFCRKKFAHFELLDLLGPITLTSSSPSIFLFRDAEWKQYSVPAPSLSSQISGKYPIAETCFSEKEEKTVLFVDEKDNNNNNNDTKNTAKLNIQDNICVKKIIWGSIPVRIPGTKIKTDSNLKPKYFQDFRARIIQRWLKSNEVASTSSYSGHILLVRRDKENGRFLNQDMKIATIVKESLEYLDSNNNNNNDNDETTSNEPQQKKKEKIKIVRVEWEKMKIRDQLRMVVNARAMIGVHGNGLTWACFMREGSFIIEFSSSINKRNEVFEGINIANAGNIAPACGMKSLSLRAPWVESEKTRKEGTFSPHHKWKLVDIEPGEREFKAVEKFVKSNGVVFS